MSRQEKHDRNKQSTNRRPTAKQAEKAVEEAIRSNPDARCLEQPRRTSGLSGPVFGETLVRLVEDGRIKFAVRETPEEADQAVLSAVRKAETQILQLLQFHSGLSGWDFLEVYVRLKEQGRIKL